MTTKWTIRKYNKTWPDDDPVWVVTAPDVRLVQEKVWVNNFLPSDRYKYCDTFAEAIAWATRKSRTVEVVLPKVEDWKVLPSKRQRVDQLAWGAIIRDTTSDYEDSGGYVYIDDSDLKPLALHLLALHYEKENQ